MTTKLLVGLDGHDSGARALKHAQALAKLIGDCELVIAYVIEWSPFAFQTAEENAQRHKRREEEIDLAKSRIVEPAVARVIADGQKASGVVQHGNVSDTLDRLARKHEAEQIIVGRVADTGIGARFFGSSTSNLVMQARVPVTVVN
ncbi:universal stress protein [Loktanella sp. 3ANDIMAR09]|uniref:universal stress protein n=1 Tax=Loktanella sp. 3ANDIMAR09 TaxID=1225657 RepID=UPI0006F8CE43|nr:universal stress protein [Loktanella sp. 3ANDIMAR09]KQI69913.1 universal stress protein [Loktanella sp. 3ANDIMAR09]